MVKVKKEKVDWDQLSKIADEEFCYSENKKELAWGKKAWGVLAKHGLTSYEDGSGKVKVFSRFLALQILHIEFLHIFWDEGSCDFEMACLDAIYSFGLDPYDVGFLISKEEEFELEDTNDINSKIKEAIAFIIRKYAREEIYSAFKEAFGSTAEIYFFFYKLIDPKADRSVLNNVDGNSMAAYSWVDDRCR